MQLEDQNPSLEKVSIMPYNISQIYYSLGQDNLSRHGMTHYDAKVCSKTK